MRELKIGEEIRIRCVEDDTPKGTSCNKCILNGFDCCDVIDLGECRGYRRTDHKNVHFEIVEEV